MAEGASSAGRAPIAPAGPIGGFLERFRRSAGVPAAAADDAAAELAPVFAVLDELDREAAELRARSRAAAEQRTQAAEREAEQILAEARTRADSERDAALRAGLEAADAEVALILSRAEAEAERIRETGLERLPGLVAEVLHHVLEAPG